MLNLFKVFLKSKFYVQYLQKKLHFFIPVTFIEWNFIKTKQHVIFRKVLQKWRLLQLLNRYFCNVFLKRFLMFHPWTIAPLVYWKELFLSTFRWELIDAGNLWKKNGNQYLWKFPEKSFYHRNHDAD